MRLIWLVLLSLPVAACSTTPFYQGLPATQSGADLTFVKGYERHELTAAPSVSYALNTEETCTNLRVAAALLWTTGAEKTVRVHMTAILAKLGRRNYRLRIVDLNEVA